MNRQSNDAIASCKGIMYNRQALLTRQSRPKVLHAIAPNSNDSIQEGIRCSGCRLCTFPLSQV